MLGEQVYEILRRAGATHLHHANTVTSSCTFLEQGGLLSRGSVADNQLRQTSQSSDAVDQKYGIWHYVFLDPVDIHQRAGKRNYYGPVLCVFDLAVLRLMPDVSVTRLNPTKWETKPEYGDRWFRDVDELKAGFCFGQFDQMVVIPAPRFDFPSHRVRIKLDDPQRQISTGEDAYNYALNLLQAAAIKGGIEASIERRDDCRDVCKCEAEYKTLGVGGVEFLFTNFYPKPLMSAQPQPLNVANSM